MLGREALRLVVVEPLAFGVEAVGDHVEPLAGHVDRRSMRQVRAERQRDAEDRVSGLEDRGEPILVWLRARLALDSSDIGLSGFLATGGRRLIRELD